LSAILAFLKLIYTHKEKIILGVMIVAFAGVAYTQWKAKNAGEAGGKGGTDSGGIVQPDDNKASPPARKPQSFDVPPVANTYPLDIYARVTTKKDIFEEPARERRERGEEKPKEWAQINVKSIFDATRSGSYIAIIEVDKRRRFVKEGEQFEEYTVQRIDGVRNCLTIVKRGEEEEKEFCREK